MALVEEPKTKGLIYINQNNSMEFLAASGKLCYITHEDYAKIEPDTFSRAGHFSEGLASVCSRSGRSWGYINHFGEVQIPLNYSYTSAFSEGLAGVRKNDMCGYINSFDEEVLPFNYKYAGPFINDLAIVLGNKSIQGYVTKFNGVLLHGYIDKKGIEYWED